MSRKEEIVNAAIELFNTHGYAEVSVKEISDYLGISPGNFTYHYSTKNELMEAIFYKMYGEMEATFSLNNDFGICELDDLFRSFLHFQNEYIFFFLDLTDILRIYPTIAAKYRETIQRRWSQGVVLLTLLSGKGLIRREEYPEAWLELSKNIWTTSTFWPVHDAVGGNLFDAEYPIRMIWRLIEPELTEKGIEEYQRIKL